MEGRLGVADGGCVAQRLARGERLVCGSEPGKGAGWLNLAESLERVQTALASHPSWPCVSIFFGVYLFIMSLFLSINFVQFVC